MRVLGLDLGAKGGLAVIVPNGGLGAVLAHKRLEGLSLSGLRAEIEHAIDVFGVTLVATEQPFIGGHARVTASQREKFAILKEVCERRGIKLVTFYPSEWKKAFCDSGKASKEQVKRAVRSRLRFEAETEHLADAAAIGAVGLSREGAR